MITNLSFKFSSKLFIISSISFQNNQKWCRAFIKKYFLHHCFVKFFFFLNDSSDLFWRRKCTVIDVYIHFFVTFFNHVFSKHLLFILNKRNQIIQKKIFINIAHCSIKKWLEVHSFCFSLKRKMIFHFKCLIMLQKT